MSYTNVYLPCINRSITHIMFKRLKLYLSKGNWWEEMWCYLVANRYVSKSLTLVSQVHMPAPPSCLCHCSKCYTIFIKRPVTCLPFQGLPFQGLPFQCWVHGVTGWHCPACNLSITFDSKDGKRCKQTKKKKTGKLTKHPKVTSKAFISPPIADS